MIMQSGPLDIPLMANNITPEDLSAVIEFLGTNPILTSSKKVREFERTWSSWLGVRHSVFVNSGSSANYLTMAVLRELSGPGEVIVPPLTWVSDIGAVFAAGLTPVFTDINRHNLCLDTEQVLSKITEDTRAVFLTHVLGFNGLTSQLLEELNRRAIPLIEDVSESHGASFGEKKLGAHGLISNFSFYFAHHLSTIEGGMVCTNDDRVYELARMFRAHGMTREMDSQELKRRYATEHSDLRPEFIFAYPGWNFRSTELNAVIGLHQLPRLDANNEIRRKNFRLFLSLLDPAKYFTDFDLEGSCNYAFILLLRYADNALRDRVISALTEAKVEFRRGTAGGGNQLRQPYLRRILGSIDLAPYPVVDFVHFFGFYLGNYPSLPEEKIPALCGLLNAL